MAEYYPIVYIRGFAMESDEVEDAFNMPHYGFNLGATQLRQAMDQNPIMQIFESPVIRLLKNENYIDSFNRFVDNQNVPILNSVGPNWQQTLWVFRFYDEEAELLGSLKLGF